ncbi:MAG: ABC transporter permease [bacterium]
MRRLWRSRPGRVGLVMTLAVLLVVAVGPLVAPHPPNQPSYAHALQPPSLANIAGTDEFGRDILSRVLFGSRISIGLGVAGVAVAGLAGTAFGLIAGYIGGWLDEAIMRVTDILLAFPGILVAIGIVAALGASASNLVLAIGLFTLPSYTRFARSLTVEIGSKEYIEAARSQGASSVRIMFYHVFRNLLGPLLVLATVSLPAAILTESTLSFLGLGLKPPTPEWGAVLSDAQNYLVTAPYMVAAPAAALVIAMLAFNLLGDGLLETFDPRARR